MEITLTTEQLRKILHAATNNTKDFAMDNEGFIMEQLRLHNVMEHNPTSKELVGDALMVIDYLGDILNGMDVVSEEDVEFTTPKIERLRKAYKK